MPVRHTDEQREYEYNIIKAVMQKPMCRKDILKVVTINACWLKLERYVKEGKMFSKEFYNGTHHIKFYSNDPFSLSFNPFEKPEEIEEEKAPSNSRIFRLMDTVHPTRREGRSSKVYVSGSSLSNFV